MHKYMLVGALTKIKRYNQWRTQKVFQGRGAKLGLNRVTSQINFMESAEDTNILGWSGGMPRENFAKLHLKIRIFVHSECKI